MPETCKCWGTKRGGIGSRRAEVVWSVLSREMRDK